jgi:hypothetical protein
LVDLLVGWSIVGSICWLVCWLVGWVVEWVGRWVVGSVGGIDAIWTMLLGSRLLKSKREPAMRAQPWLLYPWKEMMYPLYRRLGEPQGLHGLLQRI